jgi:hypothetical protein
MTPLLAIMYISIGSEAVNDSGGSSLDASAHQGVDMIELY